MGGSFSGYRWSKKRVVESCDTIDTADLKRWQMLAPGTNRAGSLQWRRGADEKASSAVSYILTVGDGTGALRLLYGMGQPAERFDYSVRLVTTACHLGGLRWWFICPLTKNGVACGRRVRKVYFRGNYFGCRQCHNLTYQSSQESDSRVYAAVRAGVNLDLIHETGHMAVSQLAFALKVLTFREKRLDRLLGRNKTKGIPSDPKS